MPRDGVREAPRSDARPYLTKAEEFVASARASFEAQRWDAAGLEAIHAAISAGDAALVASAGVRSASSDHGAVLALLDAQVHEFDQAQRRQLAGLLGKKNQVEYEMRPLREDESRTLVDQSSRFVRWARRVVDAHVPG